MKPFPEDDDALDLMEEDAVHAVETEPDIGDGEVSETMDYGAPVDPPVEKVGTPIYGGEQQVSGGPRQLVVFQPLADRSAMSHKERIALLDSDIREAMALAARRLNNEAMKYSVTGYRWNLDDIVYDMGARRILSATLRVARPE